MDEKDPGALQFDRAEYASGAAPAAACAACGQPIWDTYYQVAGQMTCERCKTGLETGQEEGSGAGRFLRATLFGSLAGALGAGLWYGVRAATGYEVGLIAILVGLMVGGAVRAGSRHRGGWLYQLLAVFLTYGSIVSTYVPLIIQAVREDRTTKAAPAGNGSAPADAPEKAPDARPSVAGADAPGPQAERPSVLMFAIGIAALFALAFAIPFLMGFKNIMGILIIGIGLYQAWKMNRRTPLEIAGPFRLGAPPASPAGG